ncbi:hypothetical protein ACRYI5_01025 [Furfurilactobacillus sp. WILCCON 0119]
MMKRVQRGIRQQTESMTAAEYEKVKRHNEAERFLVTVINDLPEPLCGPHKALMKVLMEQFVKMASAF